MKLRSVSHSDFGLRRQHRTTVNSLCEPRTRRTRTHSYENKVGECVVYLRVCPIGRKPHISLHRTQTGNQHTKAAEGAKLTNSAHARKNGSKYTRTHTHTHIRTPYISSIVADGRTHELFCTVHLGTGSHAHAHTTHKLFIHSFHRTPQGPYSPITHSKRLPRPTTTATTAVRVCPPSVTLSSLSV